MPLKIGTLTIDPPLALAPMAGITSHPFRMLAREQGCRLLYSEMVSAKGMAFNQSRSDSLLYFSEAERPIGIQLFGSDPLILAGAAAEVEKMGADFIDLNLGCPAKKITSNGEGGALMRDPALCSKIFKALTGAVSCPVTVKLRKGWNSQSVNVLDLAARSEEAGIAAITVHGRTVDQGYSGRADWEAIKLVKEQVSIPVIGNGDIDSAGAALKMLKLCRCDGIMVGRASRGNPWIFAEISNVLKGLPLPEPPTPGEIVDMALRHFTLLAEFKGEAAAAREMRRHSAWYIRGLPGAAAVRQKLVQISSYTETEKILRSFAADVASCSDEI